MKEKIIIRKGKNADTRTAKNNVAKDELYLDTISHINDVQNVGCWLADLLRQQVREHDHTKIEYLDQFYEDFTTTNQNIKFKELPWWQIHKTERHHLNDSVPEDVNLIDVLEMVIDCTVAGLARSGNVYDISIPQNVLQQAINNTKQMIIDNVEIK